MKMDNITLKEAAQIAKPYDESAHTRERFEDVIMRYPHLEQEFKEKFTEEYQKAAEEKGLYFILNRRMRPKLSLYPNEVFLRVGWCGPDNFPTVSVDF